MKTITITGVASACRLAIVGTNWVYDFADAVVGAPNVFNVFDKGTYEVRVIREGYFSVSYPNIKPGGGLWLDIFYNVPVPAGVSNIRISNANWVDTTIWHAYYLNSDVFTLMKNNGNANLYFKYNNKDYGPIAFKLDGSNPFQGIDLPVIVIIEKEWLDKDGLPTTGDIELVSFSNDFKLGNNDAAKAEMLTFFELLEDSGFLSNVKIDPSEPNLITFSYPNGIKGGFLLENFSNGVKSSNASVTTVTSDEETTIEKNDSFATGEETFETGPFERVFDENYTKPFVLDESELFFMPFSAVLASVEYNVVGNSNVYVISSFPALNASYRNVATSIRDAEKGFSVTEKTGATINDYYTLNQYGTIVIDSHGMLWNGDPAICLEEVVTAANMSAYNYDLLAGNVAVIGGNFLTGAGGRYWILPSYVSDHFGTIQTNLPNSLVYLGMCYGLATPTLASAFLNSGADSVVGYTDEISFDYDGAIVHSLFDSLLKGHNVSQALYDAVSANGESDPVFNGSCILRSNSGGSLLMFAEDIVNGSFENSIPFYGWNRFGDARIITSLMELSPTDGSNMAIISTGLGSINDSTSRISQFVNVSSAPESLSFDYDWISEEPMEWVNRGFNDQFSVELILSDGSVRTILHEDIDTNWTKWIYIPSIDFPGGDNTCYHTGWTKMVFDLSPYASLITDGFTIRFTVWDVGDSIYDSAALIDNVTLSY